MVQVEVQKELTPGLSRWMEERQHRSIVVSYLISQNIFRMRVFLKTIKRKNNSFLSFFFFFQFVQGYNWNDDNLIWNTSQDGHLVLTHPILMEEPKIIQEDANTIIIGNQSTFYKHTLWKYRVTKIKSCYFERL